MRAYYFLVILIGFCFGSCASVGYVHKQEYSIAPKQNFPEEVQSILLLNRSRERNLITRAVKSVSSGYLVGDGFSNARRLLLVEISRGYHRETRYIGEDKKGHSDRPAKRISMEDIEKKRGDSDAILCLEQYKIEEQRNYEPFEKHQLDANGNDVYLSAVRGMREVKLKTYWRLVDSRSGNILEEFPKELIRINEAEALDRPGLDLKLDTIDIITPESLSKMLAEEMLLDMNPTLIKSQWMYHLKGHDAIKESGNHIKNKNYSLAINSIKKSGLLDSSDKELSYKAYYNLSVAFYLSNDEKEAVKAAKQGYQRTGNPKLATLERKLIGR